jgi:hypothetical protein
MMKSDDAASAAGAKSILATADHSAKPDSHPLCSSALQFEAGSNQ